MARAAERGSRAELREASADAAAARCFTAAALAAALAAAAARAARLAAVMRAARLAAAILAGRGAGVGGRVGRRDLGGPGGAVGGRDAGRPVGRGDARRAIGGGDPRLLGRGLRGGLLLRRRLLLRRALGHQVGGRGGLRLLRGLDTQCLDAGGDAEEDGGTGAGPQGDAAVAAESGTQAAALAAGIGGIA